MLLSNESDITKTCNEYFTNTGFQPNITFTSTRHLYLLSMVDADLGVTILPKNLVNKQMFPNLATLPFEEPISTRIGIARLKEHEHTKQSDLLYHFFAENSN